MVAIKNVVYVVLWAALFLMVFVAGIYLGTILADSTIERSCTTEKKVIVDGRAYMCVSLYDRDFI